MKDGIKMKEKLKKERKRITCRKKDTRVERE
jgi:hypothetical protein